MNTFPFTLSSEAASWVSENLRLATNHPDAVGLLPALCYCLNYTASDEQGRVFERCDRPFFQIGWYHPEEIVGKGCIEMETLSSKLLVPPDTVQRLQGKTLVVETVEVGVPNRPDAKRQLLRAFPDENWP